MVANSLAIRSKLEEIPELPTPVHSWIVEDGIDAGDEPAVWVWAIIEHPDVESDELSDLKELVRRVVREETDGRWAYVRVRGLDEIDQEP